MPVIGLEIHVQLNTGTKMFSGEAVADEGTPNSAAGEYSLAYPGTLPLVNKEAVSRAITLGIACGSAIAPSLLFSRKNYFYADLPKGYQITQEDIPVCRGGMLEFIDGNGEIGQCALHSIHLEEDTAKSVHDHPGGVTLLDFNRSGVPLVELITQPVISNGEAAAMVVAQVRRLVRYLGVSDGNMEKGALRCDVNLSLRTTDREMPGYKVELKNINSVQAVKRAVDHEVGRQTEILNAGGRMGSETRVFDKKAGYSRRMRTKEEVEDYRYFPEPDLPPMSISEKWVQRIADQMPAPLTDWYRACRSRYGLSHGEALQLLESSDEAGFLEAVFDRTKAPRRAFFLLVGTLRELMNTKGLELQEVNVAPEVLAKLADAIEEGTVSHGIAERDILPALVEDTAADLDSMLSKAAEGNLRDASPIRAVVREIVRGHPGKVKRYLSGKKGLADMFVGLVLRSLEERVDPRLVRRIVVEVLEDPNDPLA